MTTDDRPAGGDGRQAPDRGADPAGPAPPPRDARRAEVEAAALAVLTEKGYRSTSMLQIAKRARASNGTLYAWYGGKQALFRAIIEENGRDVRALLEEALEGGTDPMAALEAVGPVLLRFTTDAKAIAMNRAAVADAAETGTLAQAIDEVARGAIMPLLCRLMERLAATGRLALDRGPEEAAQTYVALLLGEVQLRQALGTTAPLTEAEITARAARALDLTRRLYSTGGP